MENVPLLERAEEVERLAARLRGARTVAVDLEADNEHCFLDRVCLVQIGVEGESYLIDPLAVQDLSPLKAFFLDSKIRKIFHAADYDVRCLNRDFGIEVKGLFDTMVASQLTGRERIGLADVLREAFEVELDKKWQRADWGQRPLPAEMIAYAVGDTLHLEALADLLEKELRELDRWSWFIEECSILEGVRHREAEGPRFLRVKGAGGLNGRQLQALEDMLEWREDTARRLDRPLFKIISTNMLLDVAKVLPRSDRDMRRVKTLPDRLSRRWGRELRSCIDRSFEVDEGKLPAWPKLRRERPDAAQKKRLTRLKAWREKEAEARKLAPGILVNNALLQNLAREWPRDEEQLRGIEGLKNWQLEVFGAGFLEVLSAP